LHIYSKMKIDLNEEIEILEGIAVSVKNEEITMKKDGNEVNRKMNPAVKVQIEGNKIMVKVIKATKREKKIFGTFIAHFKNMMRGLDEKFKYKLESANVHFPMNISFDTGNRELVVKNFLGEKTDRKIKIRDGVDIKVNKNIIEIESVDKELAGQVSADIEKKIKPKKKDRRIYQDGIYIIEKPGRAFS